MAAVNPLWGAPRIPGELGKVGVEVSERTVSRLLRRPRRPPSQTWRTCLTNHVATLVSTDVLIAGLAQIKAVNKVISRTSVMHYKGTGDTLPQIARELVVDGIVEASVMRSGGRVTSRSLRRRRSR